MRTSKSGFTIVELLIVIVVIGILSAITLVAFNGVRARALESEKASKFSSIRKSIENYKTIHNGYPGATQITGSSGAQLIGLTLQNVEPSNANYPGNGIESGYADSGAYHIRYMAWDNPDGSGFTCNTAPCGSYILSYYDRVTNQTISVTNPR